MATALFARLQNDRGLSVPFALQRGLVEECKRTARRGPGCFDSPADFAHNDIFDRISAFRNLKVRIDCGKSDPFFRSNAYLAAQMEAQGQHPVVDFDEGCHDEWYWNRIAAEQLLFIAKTLQ